MSFSSQDLPTYLEKLSKEDKIQFLKDFFKATLSYDVTYEEKGNIFRGEKTLYLFERVNSGVEASRVIHSDFTDKSRFFRNLGLHLQSEERKNLKVEITGNERRLSLEPIIKNIDLDNLKILANKIVELGKENPKVQNFIDALIHKRQVISPPGGPGVLNAPEASDAKDAPAIKSSLFPDKKSETEGPTRKGRHIIKR